MQVTGIQEIRTGPKIHFKIYLGALDGLLFGYKLGKNVNFGLGIQNCPARSGVSWKIS
jgi:hypothetical protein